MINLPIFRGLKLGTKNEYVEGYLEEHNTSDFYISLMPNKIDAYKIDISTLSIHFPDMLDSQGNKIFASLQEDGKGGDILQYKDKHYYCNNTSYIFIFNIIYSKEYNALCVRETDEEKELDFFYELPTFIKEGLKIIGIQQ